MKSYTLFLLLVLGLSTSCTNSSDPFYTQSGTFPIVEIENQTVKIDIAQSPEESSTLTIGWNKIYSPTDLKKVKVGDALMKNASTYTISVVRDGEKIAAIEPR